LFGKSFLDNLTKQLDPDREKHEQARLRAQANLDRLTRRGEGEDGHRTDGSGGSRRGARVEDLKLNDYENVIAQEVVAPEDISVGFDGKWAAAFPQAAEHHADTIL
jgi:ATPase family AAA domain-containing protein 1